MPKYINADAILVQMKNRRYFVGRRSDPVCIIEDMPAADVEPVRHGRWAVVSGKIRRDIDKRIVQCTLCCNNLSMEGVNCGRGDANYCPNCGAKMDKEAADA